MLMENQYIKSTVLQTHTDTQKTGTPVVKSMYLSTGTTEWLSVTFQWVLEEYHALGQAKLSHNNHCYAILDWMAPYQ